MALRQYSLEDGLAKPGQPMGTCPLSYCGGIQQACLPNPDALQLSPGTAVSDSLDLCDSWLVHLASICMRRNQASENCFQLSILSRLIESLTKSSGVISCGLRSDRRMRRQLAYSKRRKTPKRRPRDSVQKFRWQMTPKGAGSHPAL